MKTMAVFASTIIMSASHLHFDASTKPVFSLTDAIPTESAFLFSWVSWSVIDYHKNDDASFNNQLQKLIAMPKNNVRVKMPRNADDLFTLAKLVYAKHTADGDRSPLNSLDDYNWMDNGSKIAQWQYLQNQVKQLEKDIDDLYRQRDLLLAPVDLTLRASRDLLLSIYKANYKELNDWDFEVDDRPKPKKQQTVKQ